jgi:SAM-dependent methyltransferase
MRRFCCFWSFILFGSLCAFSGDNASVDHKQANLNGYLREIGEEQEEKTQLLEHIIKKGNGTYLDLGTGGDSVAYIIKRISKKLPVTFIASDIDQEILDSIPVTHPSLKPFLDETKDKALKVRLRRMDATNMNSIKKSSIDGIGASALVHEVFSYVPPKSSIDQLFLELLRVLNKDGVFIYRDPKWDENPYQDCLVILKDYMAKFFTVLFLPRFLDMNYSSHVDYENRCVKPNIYKGCHIRINFFSRESKKTQKVKVDEFLNIPTSNIDFSRNVTIEAPRGLVSELQRHYILFMKNVFVTDLVDRDFFSRDIIRMDSFPTQEMSVLKSFMRMRGLKNFDKFSTDVPVFASILKEKKAFYEFMENGLYAEIKDEGKVNKTMEKLYKKGLNRSLVKNDGEMIWLDPKVAALLFNGEHVGLYDSLGCIGKDYPMTVLDWINREGEEFYFYKTTDKFITYLGRFSKYYLKGTDKQGYILAPMTSDSIKTVSRDLYKSVVNHHMVVMDIDGKVQETPFDKNIIHFRLMKESDAIAVYRDLINTKRYKRLEYWVENELG